jgi:hypothetical protein
MMHILSALFLLGARLFVNWLFVCPHTATSRLAAIKLRIIDNYVDNKADSQERYFISSLFRLSCCIFNHHHDERSNIVFYLDELFLLISS